MKRLLSVEELKEAFDYDPETGRLVWKVRQSSNVPAGTRVGSPTRNGRLLVRLKLQQMYAHRLIWAMHYGEWPKENVSALNGDYTDLRITNFVELSNGLTAQKGGPRRASKSGLKGVSWDKSRGKWIATITRNYKLKNLGRFDTKEEARAAYERAAADMGLFVMDEAERKKHYESISRKAKMRVLWNRTRKIALGVVGWESFEAFCRDLTPATDRHMMVVPVDPEKPVGPSNWKWERRETTDWTDQKSRSAHGRRHRKQFRASYRDKQLRRDFGITMADYQKMLLEQNGVCDICSRPETALRWGELQPLAVDHCHTSGKVRALLCHKCNVGIGSFGDDPERLRRAAAYLERHAPKEGSNNVIHMKRKE
jgi:hypothetical protein